MNELGLTEIKPLTSEIIINRLNEDGWISDPMQRIRVFSDLVGTLIAFDTRTRLNHDRDFPQINKFLNDLFKPLTTAGLASHYLFKGAGHRDLHILLPSDKGPGDLMEEGNKIPIVHSHFDVVEFDGDLAKNKGYQTKNGDLIFGRGIIDMKGSLASLLMSLYELKHRKQELNYAVILTPDEEISGRATTKHYLPDYNVELLLDLEPVPVGFPGHVLTRTEGYTRIDMPVEPRLTREEIMRISLLYNDIHLSYSQMDLTITSNDTKTDMYKVQRDIIDTITNNIRPKEDILNKTQFPDNPKAYLYEGYGYIGTQKYLDYIKRCIANSFSYNDNTSIPDVYREPDQSTGKLIGVNEIAVLQNYLTIGLLYNKPTLIVGPQGFGRHLQIETGMTDEFMMIMDFLYQFNLGIKEVASRD